jgi:hypothetical protein
VQLGVSQATLYRWRSDGKGPPWTGIGGKRITYQAEDVQAWLLSEEKEVLARARERLGEMVPDAIKVLRNVAENKKDPKLRAQAIRALKKLPLKPDPKKPKRALQPDPMEV